MDTPVEIPTGMDEAKALTQKLLTTGIGKFKGQYDYERLTGMMYVEKTVEWGKPETIPPLNEEEFNTMVHKISQHDQDSECVDCQGASHGVACQVVCPTAKNGMVCHGRGPVRGRAGIGMRNDPWFGEQIYYLGVWVNHADGCLWGTKDSPGNLVPSKYIVPAESDDAEDVEKEDAGYADLDKPLDKPPEWRKLYFPERSPPVKPKIIDFQERPPQSSNQINVVISSRSRSVISSGSRSVGAEIPLDNTDDGINRKGVEANCRCWHEVGWFGTEYACVIGCSGANWMHSGNNVCGGGFKMNGNEALFGLEKKWGLKHQPFRREKYNAEYFDTAAELGDQDRGSCQMTPVTDSGHKKTETIQLGDYTQTRETYPLNPLLGMCAPFGKWSGSDRIPEVGLPWGDEGKLFGTSEHGDFDRGTMHTMEIPLQASYQVDVPSVYDLDISDHQHVDGLRVREKGVNSDYTLKKFTFVRSDEGQQCVSTRTFDKLEWHNLKYDVDTESLRVKAYTRWLKLDKKI
jgi:hypothetical protein